VVPKKGQTKAEKSAVKKLHHLKNSNPEFSDSPPFLQQIIHALQGLRYGAVEIVIHEGHIVQIERREKQRPSPSERWHVSP